MRCTSCGLVIDDRYKFCPVCGAKQTCHRCSNCHALVDIDARFCSVCGTPLAATWPQTAVINKGTVTAGDSSREIETWSNTGDMTEYALSDRKQWVALTLCLLLGWTGLHRIYVGKIGTGLLWFCTGGMAFVGWIADLISILKGNFRDRNGAVLQ